MTTKLGQVHSNSSNGPKYLQKTEIELNNSEMIEIGRFEL